MWNFMKFLFFAPEYLIKNMQYWDNFCTEVQESLKLFFLYASCSSVSLVLGKKVKKSKCVPTVLTEVYIIITNNQKPQSRSLQTAVRQSASETGPFDFFVLFYFFSLGKTADIKFLAGIVLLWNLVLILFISDSSRAIWCCGKYIEPLL